MQKTKNSLKTFNRWIFWIAFLAIFSAIILAFAHSLNFCTTACVEGQNWRFFGFTFDTLGLIFLPFILVSHILSVRIPLFRTITALSIASCIGAETWFIYVQKVYIGGFCPICVGIAFSLCIAGIAIMTRFFKESFQSRNEEPMLRLTKIFPSLSALFIGFFLAFSGVAKINPLESKQLEIKDSISFGKDHSIFEVYVFTDWFCPACRKADAEIEKMMPEVAAKARAFFVDAAAHSDSLNFTPYNLSFMINNKDKYLELRKTLLTLADKNKAPTDSDVKQVVQPLGVNLKELNYSDVAIGVKLFNKLVKQFEMSETPTVVIINAATKKGKKLTGYKEITRDNVLRAIDSLQ